MSLWFTVGSNPWIWTRSSIRDKNPKTHINTMLFFHSMRLLSSTNFLPVSTKHEISNHFHPSLDYHLPFLRIRITSCIQECHWSAWWIHSQRSHSVREICKVSCQNKRCSCYQDHDQPQGQLKRQCVCFDFCWCRYSISFYAARED